MTDVSVIRFADCEVDLQGFQLRRGGEACAVEPQVFELLAYLLRHAGRLVTKDELIAEVWGGRIVSDAAISSRIKSARRAIGDDGEQQRFIRTVHGRGFRFVGTVAPAEAAADGAARIASPALPVPATLPTRPSIAVPPFLPAGAAEVDRALGDSLADEIVTFLARDRGLDVWSPGASLSFRESAEAHDRGRGPRYVLEGRVRAVEGRLVVTARLLESAGRRHVWADRSEHALDSPWAFDDRIARRIAAIVRSEIESAEAEKAAALQPDARGAWAHYHLGLQELYRFTRASLLTARAHLERAVAIEPTFAAALARLAYVRIQEYWYGAPERRAEALRHARESADGAIAADRKNALGHLASGRIHALHRNGDLAVPALEAAVRLNPSLAQTYFALGQAHFYAGEAKDAVRLLDHAIALDPDDPHFWCFLHDQSDAYYAMGELDEAARRTKAATHHANATHWPFASHASVLGTAGRLEEAREALARLRARRPDYTLATARAELAHFTDAGYVERYLEGLRRSGLTDRPAASR